MIWTGAWVVSEGELKIPLGEREGQRQRNLIIAVFKGVRGVSAFTEPPQQPYAPGM